MEIVSTAVYVGPNVYAKTPLIRLTVDLHRRAETPVADFGDALTGPLLEHLPGLATARTERGEPLLARLKEPDCHLGELMAQVAVALQNHGGTPAEIAMTRPAAHPDEIAGPLRLRIRGGRPRGRRGRPRHHPRADRARGRRLRHRRSDRRLRPLRLPPLARALGARPGPRRRGPRHPLDSAQRREPDPGRPGQVPEAHRGRAHLADLAHRRRDRRRQGALHPPPLRPRPAGPQAAPGPRRRGRRRCGQRHRLPGGGQAGRRQPRPRRLGQPDHRRRGGERLRDRPERGLRRHRREHDPRRRPPAAGHRRQPRRRRPPHARATWSATGNRRSPSSSPR